MQEVDCFGVSLVVSQATFVGMAPPLLQLLSLDLQGLVGNNVGSKDVSSKAIVTSQLRGAAPESLNFSLLHCSVSIDVVVVVIVVPVAEGAVVVVAVTVAAHCLFIAAHCCCRRSCCSVAAVAAVAVGAVSAVAIIVIVVAIIVVLFSCRCCMCMSICACGATALMHDACAKACMFKCKHVCMYV